MEYPSKDGRVDGLLARVETDLPRFMQLMELEDVAALRSMLRDSNPQYDAACDRYGVSKREAPTVTPTVPAMISPDSSNMKPAGTSMDELDRLSAAERLKKKADEVAAGMNFHKDEHGMLFTTIKMESDAASKSVGVWLPPVGFEECHGDIFHTKTVKEIDPKELFGVQGAGTSSTYSYIKCTKPPSMAKSGKHRRKEEQRPTEEMGLVDLELLEICGRLDSINFEKLKR